MNNSSEGASTKSKAGSSQPSDTSFKRKRGIFHKELRHMMYGYGDDRNPLPETMALVEDIVVDYVTDLVYKAQDVAVNRGKMFKDDLTHLLQKDLPKVNRCTELLQLYEQLVEAKLVCNDKQLAEYADVDGVEFIRRKKKINEDLFATLD